MSKPGQSESHKEAGEKEKEVAVASEGGASQEKSA